jgi:hypothetical protein
MYDVGAFGKFNGWAPLNNVRAGSCLYNYNGKKDKVIG